MDDTKLMRNTAEGTKALWQTTPELQGATKQTRNCSENPHATSAAQYSNGTDAPSRLVVSTLDLTKAEELSKAIASDFTSLNLRQSSPQELQSIIHARLLTLLNLGSSAKRTSEDASLDEAGTPRAKRVTCRSCPKIMERPCDLKYDYWVFLAFDLC